MKLPKENVTHLGCAKYLGRHLHFMSNVSESDIGIKFFKEAPKILYLTFLDNCLIFCKANKRETRMAKNILEIFKRFWQLIKL